MNWIKKIIEKIKRFWRMNSFIISFDPKYVSIFELELRLREVIEEMSEKETTKK